MSYVACLLATITDRRQLNNCTSVRAGLVKLISAEEQERLLTKGDIQVVGQVSLKSMMKALVHVGAFTTIIPFAFAYFFQPSDSIKDISASWVHIPGDLISRWGVMVSVQLLFWMQLGLFFSRQSWSTFRYTNLMLGLIALPGLAVAGVVDISEDDQIHTAGAVVFFAMSLLDMFSSAVDKFFSGAGNRCAVNAMLLISSVAVGATAYCFHDAVDFEHRSFHLQNVSSVTMVVYQWAMVVLMGLFYTLQGKVVPQELNSLGLQCAATTKPRQSAWECTFERNLGISSRWTVSDRRQFHFTRLFLFDYSVRFELLVSVEHNFLSS